MEVVADKDVIGAQPADELAISPFEVRSPLAFPDALLALSARGHRVEDAVMAELDVNEEKGQVGPREVATGGS